MAGRLEGKVCVITGAGGGMGREGAIVFTGEGAKVCVADVDLALAEETARTLERVRAVVRARDFARVGVRAAVAAAGRAVASMCQARNASPTDQAWKGQPRGAWGASPSAISGR